MPDEAQSPEPRLTEGVDYTVEAGRWVFSRAYLLRRGYCCGSGCRNCPYGDEDNPARRDAQGHNA